MRPKNYNYAERNWFRWPCQLLTEATLGCGAPCLHLAAVETHVVDFAAARPNYPAGGLPGTPTVPEPRQGYRLSGLFILLGDRVACRNTHPPDTIDDVHLALRGLSHRMEVEVEPGIPLAAHAVADLRARTTWPPGLQLIVPDSLIVPQAS